MSVALRFCVLQHPSRQGIAFREHINLYAASREIRRGEGSRGRNGIVSWGRHVAYRAVVCNGLCAAVSRNHSSDSPLNGARRSERGAVLDALGPLRTEPRTQNLAALLVACPFSIGQVTLRTVLF